MLNNFLATALNSRLLRSHVHTDSYSLRVRNSRINFRKAIGTVCDLGWSIVVASEDRKAPVEGVIDTQTSRIERCLIGE